MQIKISHTIDLPDPRRMELYRRNPDLGPRILLFSGGSALRKTSEELVYYTHNSILHWDALPDSRMLASSSGCVASARGNASAFRRAQTGPRV